MQYAVSKEVSERCPLNLEQTRVRLIVQEEADRQVICLSGKRISRQDARFCQKKKKENQRLSSFLISFFPTKLLALNWEGLSFTICPLQHLTQIGQVYSFFFFLPAAANTFILKCACTTFCSNQFVLSKP